MMRLRALCIFIVVGIAVGSNAKGILPDTTTSANPRNIPSRWGYSVIYNPGSVLGLDKWARKEIVTHRTWSVAGELRYTPQPQDDNPFADDYDYPTLSVGFRYTRNHGTELTRVTKDYNSVLGDVATLYGKFSRPFIRTRHFELAYYLGTGVGYSHKCYNKTDEVNNEFIGSHWNIYFTGGLAATYKIDREWGVQFGVDYSHHSNGALNRPNKGTNILGPFLGLNYTPSTGTSDKAQSSKHVGFIRDDYFLKGLYLELSAGVGAKTLLEDWFYTQQSLSPDNPRYRQEDYAVYGNISFQTALMYRYARRWASGISIDVLYGDYANKIAHLDDITGHPGEKHSPWSVGLGLKHEVFFGRLSARMGIGGYVYRHMGYVAGKYETPQKMYEHIGLFYSFPKLRHAAFGFSIFAHGTKADFSQLVITYPIKL